jgi:hypothetical protein
MHTCSVTPVGSSDEDQPEIALVDEADGMWFRVTSGRLSQPIDLKVKIQPGRAKVVGLRIDNGREVTSSELRLPLSELADSVYDWLASMTTGVNGDLSRLEEEARGSGLELDFSRVDGLLAGAVAPTAADELMLAIVDLVGVQAAVERLHDQLADEEPLKRSRGRGAKPPTDADYQRFARVFDAERTSRAWGAQSRTAEQFGMDRSTALRWIRACEERGLLEPRSET